MATATHPTIHPTILFIEALVRLLVGEELLAISTILMSAEDAGVEGATALVNATCERWNHVVMGDASPAYCYLAMADTLVQGQAVADLSEWAFTPAEGEALWAAYFGEAA